MAYEFDDADAFLDLNVFGEKVIYKPRSGLAREIVVVIQREHPKAYGPTGARIETAPIIDVWLKKDPIEGAEQIDTGGDLIRFERIQGRAATDQPISEILGDSTPTMWHVRIR